MNEHDIERIAAAVNVLRPDWPTQSLRTFISNNLADRPRRDVMVAFAWISCEPNTSKPARILAAGPWWKAATVEGGHQVEAFDPVAVCGTCGEIERRCRAAASINDHEFTSVVESKRAAVPPPALFGADS